METIRGIVDRFLKRDEKSFVLVHYEDPESGKLVETRLSARMGQVKEGDAFLADGSWVNGTYRGMSQRKFLADAIRPAYPQTLDGIRLFLDLSFPQNQTGIDRPALHALTVKYREETIRELFADPELLVAASSNAARYREKIHSIVAAKGAGLQARELMVKADFDDPSIEKVLTRFKSAAYDTIMSNPFEVMEAEIPFDKADRLGTTVGVNGADERRITAAIWNYIRAAESMGSSLINLSGAMQEIAQNSGLPEDVIRAAVAKKIDSKDTTKYYAMRLQDTEEIYALSAASYRAETAIASALCSFARRGGGHDPELVHKTAKRVLAGTLLDEHQRKAVLTAATHRVSVITGGPGTGKSTIMKSTIRLLKELGGTDAYLISAPTGKAAQRAEETTDMEATTVQMLLGMHKDEETGVTVFRRNRDNPLSDNCLVMVDEMSMADNELFAALLAAMPASGRLILQGDPQQLPSVGVGRVLADLLEINVDGHHLIPVVNLVNVYRQDGDSKIVLDSQAMQRGEVPLLTEASRGGTSFKECASHQITSQIVKLYKDKFIPAGLDVLRDVAVIAPQAPGQGGTWELNEALARELNPGRKSIPGVEYSSYDKVRDNRRVPLPHVGDRVMLTENDHDTKVMNGDVGFIRGYRQNPDQAGRYLIQVEFDNGKKKEIPSREWRNLPLAYAITCHKSQGSQFPVVVLPFSEMHRGMADRTLVFTAWTRAQKAVIGVGSKDVLAEFVQTEKSTNRFTILRPLTEALARSHNIKPLGEKMKTVPAPRFPGLHSFNQNRTPSSVTPLSARPAPGEASSVGVRRRRVTTDAAAAPATTAPSQAASNSSEGPKPAAQRPQPAPEAAPSDIPVRRRATVSTPPAQTASNSPTAPSRPAPDAGTPDGLAVRRRRTVSTESPAPANSNAPKPAETPSRPAPAAGAPDGLAVRRRRTVAPTEAPAPAPAPKPATPPAAPQAPSQTSAQDTGLGVRRRRSLLGAAVDSQEQDETPPPKPGGP